MHAPETQARETGPVHRQSSEAAAHQRHLDRFGSVLFRHDYSRISLSDLPRLAAMSSGSFMTVRPLMVARTTLIGLVEPMHLASTSCTPSTSNTARIAPPAIIPVPCEA